MASNLVVIFNSQYREKENTARLTCLLDQVSRNIGTKLKRTKCLKLKFVNCSYYLVLKGIFLDGFPAVISVHEEVVETHCLIHLYYSAKMATKNGVTVDSALVITTP